MSKVDRQPAVKRPPQHPAADLPARDSVPASAATPATSGPTPSTTGAAQEPSSAPPKPVKSITRRSVSDAGPTLYEGPEKYSQVMNVRVRPSTEDRVHRVLDNLPRSWSKQALTDAALNEFIERYDLDPQGS